MKKYLRIVWAFARYGLIWAMEYRFNFLIWGLIGVMWTATFVFSADLIFGQVHTVAGWTRSEALLLIATEAMFVGLMWFFVFPNLQIFSRLIRKGELDFLLIKPVNSRFLVSIRDWGYDPLVRVIVVGFFIASLVSKENLPVTAISVFGYIFLLLCGMVIFYNLFFAAMVTNFWMIKNENLIDLFHNIMDAGRFPAQIYKGVFEIIFTFAIPIVYVATFPVQALLNRTGPGTYLLAVVLVGVTTFASQWFWNFALRHYTSASS